MSRIQFGNINEGGNEIRFNEIIERQNQQYERLKEEFLRQRLQYQECYKKYQREEAELQQNLEMLREERKTLEEELQQLVKSKESEEQEASARDLIEEVWGILQNYRQTLFEQCQNETKPNNKRNLQKASPNFSQMSKSSFQDEYEEIKEEFDNQMFEPEIDAEMPLFNNNFIEKPTQKSPFSLSISQPVTPVPELPLQMEVQLMDSIASRRTPRGPTVFYGEPDLRRKYDPNGPFVFGSAFSKSPSSHSRRRSHH